MAAFDLTSTQNSDGGWPFRGRESCTEPTALAALALAASGHPGENYKRALIWLKSMQRSDGGWAPMASVNQSTWVTSLVMLLPPADIGSASHIRGVDWLLSLQGQETKLTHRLGQRLRGHSIPREEINAGWPWYPGAAAWVGSTSTALLALLRERPGAEISERITAGRRFLLARRCVDGGWNHGSARALGIEAESYPETTGLALLALRGVSAASLGITIECAFNHFSTCRSVEAASWLRLGLRAHGIADERPVPVDCHDPRDRALQMLAAIPVERNPFL